MKIDSYLDGERSCAGRVGIVAVVVAGEIGHPAPRRYPVWAPQAAPQPRALSTSAAVGIRPSVRKLFDRPERATPLLCAQGNETGLSVVWAKRRVFSGLLAAPAPAAVGFPLLRFAIPVAVKGL